jgi:OmpA-OmpF porin, OOP family
MKNEITKTFFNEKSVFLFVAILILFHVNMAYSQVTTTDGDWSKNFVFLKNTPEAQGMIRVGDVDNLNCGWAEGFNPFCGQSTDAHEYPMKEDANDIPGLDHILLGTSYKGTGGDGYSDSYSPKTKPKAIKIPLRDLKGMNIASVKMQIFIDDFQSPSLGSDFTATLNGKRFINLEKILKVIDQSGPIGKLVTLDIPNELLPEFSKDSVMFYVDDPTTGIGDGFSFDFIKVLVNPVKLKTYKGIVEGRVIEKDGTPLENVLVTLSGIEEEKTNSDGYFLFNDVTPGLAIVKAYKDGYANAYQNADVICDQTSTIEIVLLPSQIVQFKGKEIKEGESVTLSKIQFNAASAVLTPSATEELNSIFDFLSSNGQVTIELDGYTSSEGDPIMNKNLSLQRVDACKKFLVDKGIEGKRIFTIGYGPEYPVAPNDTEENRAKNRRVEMKISKINTAE